MVKIFLDPGHGGQDPGAVANGLQEKVLVLDIAKRIEKKLKGYPGIQVKLSRTTDKFLSLSERANLANSWGADYFISVHINAGGGDGYEDFIYNRTSSEATKANQNIMNTEVVKETSFDNRGKKQANFAVLRLTSLPAILTENGFIDDKSDANKLKSANFRDRVAHGHVNAIVKVFGLNKSKKPAKPIQSKSKQKEKEFLTVDGKWGTETTYELQKALGTIADGIISDQLRNTITEALYGSTIDFGNGKKGSLAIKALQSKIGANVDGLLGPNTIGRLQKYLGTVYDKKLSRPSLVVKELQRRLNKGTF
ncbi:N-acetylmuramoyl-L-alanine amidase family protein [Gracilibacillus suaedae]|uniref:N-acetylmuramoyl-L-alanine amidase family protein n=1 Tax=Gracilibacillus suaedae TaxID=2820273 RepID=UPI001ABE70A8|nr:N-acetylmuramoyl-L-alanine amidase [Gracilibacillus suaedae]